MSLQNVQTNTYLDKQHCFKIEWILVIVIFKSIILKPKRNTRKKSTNRVHDVIQIVYCCPFDHQEKYLPLYFPPFS